MSIRNRAMSNRFGYDSRYAQMNAVSDYLYKGRDYYAQPDMEKRFLRTRSDFNTILSIAKENYVGTEDPDSYEARMALGQIIHQLYPTIDAQYAAENAEDLMYYATGYNTDVKGLRDQFVNTFHSAGSSLLASMKIANLYIQGAFAGYDDETWIEKKKEAKKDLSRYAMNYRTDLTEYDNAISGLLSEPVTATAEMLPSMLPSLGISAIAAAISVATGGAAIPATTAGLIKAWNTLSGVQKATAAASIGGRFTTSALMEMGGSALDMMNAGFDDDVIFGISSLVGLTNGVLETVGDKAIDVALKPFTELADAAGRKTANKIIRTSIRDTLREFRNDTGKSILSESTTEVLQEFSSMFGYNMAVNIQKERGNLPEGIRAYTAQDFRDAAFEVAKSTAMGTAVLGAGSGLLRFAGRFAGGELRRSLQADKYTKADGATARIATSNIDYENTTIAPDQDIERQGPISVVRIGDRYRAMHTTDEERAAISRSKQVYVREVDYSTETAIGKKVDFDTVDMHSPAKRSVVESVINSGMSNGKMAGFTYYNENLARVADPSKAAYISLVESRDSDPIMIPLSEESNVSAVQLQKDIYGETIEKVSPAPEPEENPGTSSEDSAEESEAIDEESEIIQDEEAEEADTFTDEELSEAESAIDELDSAEEPAEAISAGSSEDAESETAIQENTESDEMVVPESEAIVQENTAESETALPETEGSVAEIPMQEDAPETQAETTEEAPAQIAGADTVQDTRTPEEIRADEDTARRNERNQARINAQNEWDQVQRMLTGTDSAKDVDVLTVYFSSILGQTRLGESAPAVEASARAAAEIAVGFARASGLKGKDYYNTINAFMSEDFIPEAADGTVFGDKLGWLLKDSGERYINIMKNADPSTLIHELGHHFLSVLTPDMPAYNLIHEVYAKAIERDGGIIGKDANEAFARDLEKYVYFRKSSNSRLNAIFQRLYDVAKALWQTLKGDERLSSKKVKMFDAIFAEEQIPEAVSAEVAKSADKAMSSDSDTKMSDMAAELVSETAESAEETPEAVNAQAEYVIDSIDNEAAEVLRDISVDYVPDSEPEPIPDGADTIGVPQTEEEIAAGEPVQREVVEESAVDESLNYAVDIDIDEIDADPKKFYKKRLNAGKVDSKAIEKQIKSKNNQKYFDEISAQYDADSPIVGMASTANIYKAISGITGVSDLDTDFAEFFYAKDGGIYVLLKKDIRVSSEDETTAFLQDKPEPKFWKIPFSGNDISVDDIAYEYYIDNLPEVVEREYTTDADGNIIYREDAEAAPTEAEDIADQDEYDITEEDSEDEGGYEIGRRVKNTFTGYSDPFVTAVTFAKSYESKPELYFSSNNTEAVREAADLIEGSLSSTTIANSYKRFTKYIEELKKKFGEHFDDFEAENYKDSPDIAQERADYIWEEVAKELQLDDVDASEAEQFAGYLKITEKAGIMDKMPGIPYDMRDDVILTVARDLINTSKSYLTNGKILRDGISNPKLFNNAVKLLRSLVESMSKANNVTQVRDSIASMLRNNKAANALDTDKPIAGIWLDVYTAFQKNRNTGSVTEDKIRTLIEALVDENGTPRFVTQTRDGLHLTSPLIVLSNFYSSSSEGANRSNDSFTVASEAYLDIAQKQIRERINPDDAKDAAASSFINLFTMARNKFGNEFLNTYFGSRISMSKADALLAAMSKRVDALKKQAQEVRDNPETERQLKESEKNIAGLQRTIERLQKALDDSKGNISELKKQIRNQAKDNETMLEWLSEIDDLGSIEEAQARINDLVSQHDALQRKHERMIAARDSKIAELKKRIDYLLTHAPELKTAKEIRDQLDDIIKAIRNRADKGNARVAVQLKEILDFLMSDTSKNVKYDPSIFKARWSEYNGYYNMLRYFVESRMVKDGYLVSSMASLDLQDLAQLDDIVTNIVGFGVDEMNYRKMQEDTKWARRMTYALRGIPKFSNLEFNHEAMDKLIDELEKGNVPGSVESRIESGAISGLISEFTQIDNALKAINPALHNIIFGGGLVEGERISDNLNSAQEQYVKMVDERQHKVAEKFAEIFKPADFGLNVKGNKFSPEDFMVYQERAFRNEHVKIGNMTLEEFQAKHGSFGKITQKGAVFTGQVSAKPGTMWYELSRRILSEELQYRRNQIKFKKNPSDLAEMNERYRKMMSGKLTNTFTMENLMEIYKLAMQEDGLNRLIIAPESSIATNNLSIENILWVVDNLSEGGSLSNYGRFAEALQKIEAERYPDLSEVYYLMENEILPEIDFYSAIRDDRSVAEEVNQKDLRINASENERSSLDTSFIKERTNPKRAADLNGISITMNAIRDQEKYISQAILLKKYSEMFKKNGALDLALEKAYGTDGKLLSSSLRKWLGQIIDENNRTPRTRTENTIAKLRSNMVRSVLWAAPSVIMQQFPTYILVARRIGMRNATAQLFSTISNRKGVAQFVYSKSKQMKDRARIETAEYRQRAGEFAKDPIFLEKLKREGYSRRALRGREQFERFIRWGMDLQQKVDTAVANSMWLALYNHYSATMERGNLSDADFDAMVSERATQEVLSIQPSQYAKDNALAYNSRNEALKTLLLFTSSLNKEFNMIFEDYLSGRFNGFTREKIGNLIESFMYISLVSLAISFISGRQWPDDDDDKELKATLSRMAKGTMSESFGIIPGIGSILSDVATGEVYYDTGTAGTILNLIKVLAKNPEDRREGQLANAISKSFVEAFQLTGIPSNTPMKVYDAITELNPGELVNSQWADFYSYIRD